MKITSTLVGSLLLLAFFGSHLGAAPVGTAFTYQGRLTDGGQPANGSYDLEFSLYDHPSSGSGLVAGPITNSAVTISNGLFTTTLDFGEVIGRIALWLQIGVRSHGAVTEFMRLSPRQELTPTPYAIYASGANTAVQAYSVTAGSIYSSSLAAGAVTEPALAEGAVTAAKIAEGTITTSDVSPNTFWTTAGNGGTSAGPQFVGTTDNQPLELKVDGQRALRIEPDGSSPRLIGGYEANTASAAGAVIGGGGSYGSPNQVGGAYGAVLGGLDNTVGGDLAVVGGGQGNRAEGMAASVGGGAGNRAVGIGSFVGGGGWDGLWLRPNSATGTCATVSGGVGNTIAAGADYSTIGGGYDNTIASNAYSSTISGGMYNWIASNIWTSTIGGGYGNTIESKAVNCTIGGGYSNTIASNAYCSTIGGGVGNTIASNAYESTIGGGGYNTIASNAYESTIGGGVWNTIASNAYESTIGGGVWNTIASNAYYSTIGGGWLNTIAGNAYSSTIGGGWDNEIASNAYYSTIGGGVWNTIESKAYESTIGGGYQNSNAALRATIGGGFDNRIGLGADNAVIGGGRWNRIDPAAYDAVIPGGQSNRAGSPFSFAAGRRAKATREGTFVWADSQDFDFDPWIHSPGGYINSFNVRATGGIFFITAIDGAGNGTAGPYAAAGSGGWSWTSDRDAKDNFLPADGPDMLARLAAMPIQTWNYKSQPPAIRHVGPTAQDFRASFGLGESDTGINSVDASGVALAAIQGLNQKLEEQLETKEAEIAGLEARLERLERLLNPAQHGEVR